MRLAALLLLPALSATLPAQTAAPAKPAYTYVKLVDTMVASAWLGRRASWRPVIRLVVSR